MKIKILKSFLAILLILNSTNNFSFDEYALDPITERVSSVSKSYDTVDNPLSVMNYKPLQEVSHDMQKHSANFRWKRDQNAVFRNTVKKLDQNLKNNIEKIQEFDLPDSLKATLVAFEQRNRNDQQPHVPKTFNEGLDDSLQNINLIVGSMAHGDNAIWQEQVKKMSVDAQKIAEERYTHAMKESDQEKSSTPNVTPANLGMLQKLQSYASFLKHKSTESMDIAKDWLTQWWRAFSDTSFLYPISNEDRILRNKINKSRELLGLDLLPAH